MPRAEHTVAARCGRIGLCLALLCSAAALPAQTSQTGILQGQVMLSDGRVIANASITMQQPDGSYPRVARSDQFGNFRINFITPGTYDVTVRQIGFQPTTYSGILIRAAEVQRLSAIVQLAAAELQAVTVSADAMAINRTTTEFTSTLSARERELLPAARDANALINFTPGARPGQVFGGSTGQANLYQLDGVMVNQPGSGGSFLLPNVDWIEDFKVIGLGAGAEYGNFQGGLINIVTKSGSNTLRGQVRTFFENRALNAGNVNARESGAELDGRTEINAEVRGPIIRNSLYFYLSGQEARGRTRVVDFGDAQGEETIAWLPTLTERREQKYYGKLTWQATERDIVNASAGIDNLTRERAGLSSFNAIDAAVQGQSPGAFYQASWQRTINSNRFLDIKLSGYSGRDDELPYNGSDFPAVVLLDAPNAPQFANSYYTRRNSPSSIGVSGAYDAYFSTRGGTQHHLRVGAEYNIGLWREQRTRNGDYTWYTEAGENFDPLTPATWQEIPSLGVYATTDTGGRIDLNADTRNSALYVQDYIRINDRLSLSAGLRLGMWQGFITPGNGGGSGGTDRFQAVRAIGLDPRFGATYDLSGDGGLVGKAHWGRFHQNLFALFYDRAPGANVFTDIEYCDWNDTDRTNLPQLGQRYSDADFEQLFTCFPGVNLLNEAGAIEDYRQPYMDQITLGLEKSIGRNLKAEMVYINRRNRSVLSLVDKNVGGNWSPITNVRVSDAAGSVLDADGQELVLPVVYVRSDNLRQRLRAGDEIPGYAAADSFTLAFSPNRVIRPVDEAERNFQQVQLSLAGSYARLNFNAALAFTNLTGNVFSVNGYFNPNGEGNGPFVEPNSRTNFSGRLDNYSPWDAKVRVSGELPWGFEGGAFFTYISGDFWTPTLNVSRQLSFQAAQPDGSIVDLDRDLFLNAVGQNIFAESRGSRQFDGQLNLDVRLQRVLSIRRHDVIVGFEVFNVFNGDAVSALKRELNNQSPGDVSSLAGAVRLRQPPRVLRLNLQYRL